ncbi:PmoA family protein, partial [candidate division KSB1 bacterium]
DTPVSIPLDQISVNQDHGLFRLYEISAGRVEVPCQLEMGQVPRLWWIMRGATESGTSRTFELTIGDTIQIITPIKTALDENKLVLLTEKQKILQYNHGMVYPPAGVDDIYKRSGFIHPLWSPAGELLTRIQPPDHYHHYGIWAPWTKTIFEGRDVDFWNLATGQGTVRFAGYVSVVEGPVYAGFKVRQEHVDFTAKGADKVALNELIEVRAWNVREEQDIWLLDYATTLNCASSSPIDLDAYRYGGGIGFRAVESWTNENVCVVTSAGKTRKDADGSRAFWCDVSGANDAGRSGILFMSHPTNREHPEPMRVWPEDANAGRGDLFFEFCPIRHDSWRLNPGQDYMLRYRLLVYDGEMDVETAERVWRDFAYPPRVELKVE